MAVSENQKLMREFLEYMEIERGASLKTVANYERYLTLFFSFTKVNTPKAISLAVSPGSTKAIANTGTRAMRKTVRILGRRTIAQV